MQKADQTDPREIRLAYKCKVYQIYTIHILYKTSLDPGLGGNLQKADQKNPREIKLTYKCIYIYTIHILYKIHLDHPGLGGNLQKG